MNPVRVKFAIWYLAIVCGTVRFLWHFGMRLAGIFCGLAIAIAQNFLSEKQVAAMPMPKEPDHFPV